MCDALCLLSWRRLLAEAGDALAVLAFSPPQQAVDVASGRTLQGPAAAACSFNCVVCGSGSTVGGYSLPKAIGLSGSLLYRFALGWQHLVVAGGRELRLCVQAVSSGAAVAPPLNMAGLVDSTGSKIILRFAQETVYTQLHAARNLMGLLECRHARPGGLCGHAGQQH